MLSKILLSYSALMNRRWELIKRMRQNRFLANPEKNGNNFVFIYHRHKISESQYYPFHYYRKEIEKRYGLKGIHLDLEELPKLYARQSKPLSRVKLVGLQTRFDISKDKITEIFTKLRNIFPNAKFIYFDWFAPTDLRMANLVDEYVDLYIKKNLIKDFSEYDRSHQGDTNLTDYYGRLYGITAPTKHYRIPAGFKEKLRCGPSFITAPVFSTPFSKGRKLLDQNRPIDLHARLGGGGEGWYGMMRDHARSKVKTLNLHNVAEGGSIGFREYLQELSRSKMTFSPFGYGEVCWRDFEAIALGSLLIKPAMHHMSTEPNLFIPGETYVPIKWDFSDFPEKVQYYLDNEEARFRITRNAFDAGYDYLSNSRFMDHVDMLVQDAKIV